MLEALSTAPDNINNDGVAGVTAELGLNTARQMREFREWLKSSLPSKTAGHHSDIPVANTLKSLLESGQYTQALYDLYRFRSALSPRA